MELVSKQDIKQFLLNLFSENFNSTCINLLENLLKVFPRDNVINFYLHEMHHALKTESSKIIPLLQFTAASVIDVEGVNLGTYIMNKDEKLFEKEITIKLMRGADLKAKWTLLNGPNRDVLWQHLQLLNSIAATYAATIRMPDEIWNKIISQAENMQYGKNLRNDLSTLCQEILSAYITKS